MKINQSTVAMSAGHQYSKVQSSSTHVFYKWEQAQEEKQGEGAASLSISDESKERMEKQRQLEKEEREKQLKQNGWQAAGAGEKTAGVSSREEMQSQIIKRLIEMLEALRKGRMPDVKAMRREAKDWKALNRQETAGGYSPVTTNSQRQNGTWTRQVISSGFTKETENTAFSSVGMVKTSDGREINFGITMEMSRSFESSYCSYWEQKNVIYTDPLVINMDTDTASISDQTFLFDLDCDGKEEELAGLGAGSGFLALDKNGDGVINDGSELFGTKSGNGFADLAAYDEDGNGWIDENDSVFDKLKIWTKNEDGSDKLVGIGKAGVGAVYLGYAETPFSLNDEKTNASEAVIRSTGVFLKESGEAGTIQHVDFAI